MSALPKKPRIDEPERQSEEEDDDSAGNTVEEQEETLIALIDHRVKEVQNLRSRVAYYTNQLEIAKKKLLDDQRKLARLRKTYKVAEKDVPSSVEPVDSGGKMVVEDRQTSNSDPVPETDDEPFYLYTRPPKPKLLIPTGPFFSQPSKNATSYYSSSGAFPLAKNSVVVKEENTSESSSDSRVMRVQDIGTKSTYEPKEHCRGVVVANEKNSCGRSPNIGTIGVQQHGGNQRRYELEEHKEHHKGAIFVKEENSSGSSSDIGVMRVQGIGTKRKYAEPKEQFKGVVVGNEKNSFGRSSATGAVIVQHGGVERRYEPKEHHKGAIAVKEETKEHHKGAIAVKEETKEHHKGAIAVREENSSGSSSDTKRKYEKDHKKQNKGAVIVSEEKSCGRLFDNGGAIRVQDGGPAKKNEAKQHKDLIPLICSNSSPCTISCESSSLFSSQHKRKLRSLSLCPADDMLFATSALDGVVNLWKIQGKGSGASLLSSTDCLAEANNRRWPEDIAWHPHGKSIYCVYTADKGSSQVSILNLNKHGEDRNSFLEPKPHTKGIINSIVVLPWEVDCFVTGGSDHSVVLWEGEGDDISSWETTILHRNMHSSAVMGVAGMPQRRLILSVGVDKKIFGYDARTAKISYRHQIDTKCMSIVPNPCDLNLFMVQTGKHERQLRLFDIRDGQKEVHSFGWKQQSSESQSALIGQAWSPDGLYISSGSADPVINIFDIRYNANKPSQLINAHQKRVFKAVWHRNLPLLVSISSDLNISMHKVVT